MGVCPHRALSTPILQMMFPVPAWRKINRKVWEEDVPIMTEAWAQDGWRVARIHTLKSGDWYKAEIRYTRTAEDGTIHYWNEGIWREPSTNFKPTGTTYEIDSPGKIIFTWYPTHQSLIDQLGGILGNTALASAIDSAMTPAADAARDAQSEEGTDNSEGSSTPALPTRVPAVKRVRSSSPLPGEERMSKRMPMPGPDVSR